MHIDVHGECHGGVSQPIEHRLRGNSRSQSDRRMSVAQVMQPDPTNRELGDNSVEALAEVIRIDWRPIDFGKIRS